MKKMKKVSTLAALALLPFSALAQFQDASNQLENFRDFMYLAAPIGFIIALLGGAIFNIGKVWGDNRDWKGYFTSIGLFVLAVAIIAGLTAWLTTLRFG